MTILAESLFQGILDHKMLSKNTTFSHFLLIAWCSQKLYFFISKDTFLPFVENGTITLIGATTENPSFKLNNALLSRCRVIVLEKLSMEDIEQILCRALDDLGVAIIGGENSARPKSPVCITGNRCVLPLLW